MKEDKAVLVTVEQDVEDGVYYHDMRWSRNHIKDIVVNFEDRTIKVVLKNGDVSKTDYKDLLDHVKHNISPPSDESD